MTSAINYDGGAALIYQGCRCKFAKTVQTPQQWLPLLCARLPNARSFVRAARTHVGPIHKFLMVIVKVLPCPLYLRPITAIFLAYSTDTTAAVAVGLCDVAASAVHVFSWGKKINF